MRFWFRWFAEKGTLSSIAEQRSATGKPPVQQVEPTPNRQSGRKICCDSPAPSIPFERKLNGPAVMAPNRSWNRQELCRIIMTLPTSGSLLESHSSLIFVRICISTSCSSFFRKWDYEYFFHSSSNWMNDHSIWKIFFLKLIFLIEMLKCIFVQVVFFIGRK